MAAGVSLLSLFGAFAGLLCAEIGLRLAVAAVPSWSHPVAKSWRLNAERPPIPTAIGLDDWTYGARYVPGLKRYPEAFEEGVFHVSTSNRFRDAGFRDDRDSGDAPLLALGDSFTGCFGVESDECWVTLLARDLGVEFANLGMWAGGGSNRSAGWTGGAGRTILA